MLDRLPTELLSAILLLAGRGRGQQRNYYNAALVSHKLYEVAKPLMWQVIHLTRPAHVESILAGKGDKERAGRTRRLYVTHGTPFGTRVYRDELRLPDVFESLPNVEEIELFDPQIIAKDLASLSILQYLRSLTLLQITLVDEIRPSHTFVLPHLVKLSLTHSTFDPDSADHFFSPKRLPSLKVLFLKHTWSDSHDMSGYLHVPMPRLLRQLDSIVLELDVSLDGSSPPPELKPFAERILYVMKQFFADSDLLATLAVRHVSLALPNPHHADEDDEDDEVVASEDMWLALLPLLEQPKPSLETLWLPDTYREPPTLPKKIEEVRSKVLAAVAKTEVKLSWGLEQEYGKEEFCRIRGYVGR